MVDVFWVRLVIFVVAFGLGYVRGWSRGMVRGFRTCRRYMLTRGAVPPDAPFISVPDWNQSDA